MKITLIEIDELSPWEIDDFTQRAKSYFEPYVKKDATQIKTQIKDGRRVCRCFRCGGFANVTGGLVTQILCDVCGTYAYQLNQGGTVRVYVKNSVRKDGDLLELNLSQTVEIEIQSTSVDPKNHSHIEWLNKILGV